MAFKGILGPGGNKAPYLSPQTSLRVSRDSQLPGPTGEPQSCMLPRAERKQKREPSGITWSWGLASDYWDSVCHPWPNSQASCLGFDPAFCRQASWSLGQVAPGQSLIASRAFLQASGYPYTTLLSPPLLSTWQSSLPLLSLDFHI